MFKDFNAHTTVVSSLIYIKASYVTCMYEVMINCKRSRRSGHKLGRCKTEWWLRSTWSWRQQFTKAATLLFLSSLTFLMFSNCLHYKIMMYHKKYLTNTHSWYAPLTLPFPISTGQRNLSCGATLYYNTGTAILSNTCLNLKAMGSGGEWAETRDREQRTDIDKDRGQIQERENEERDN